MDVDVDGEDIDAKGKKKFGFHMPKFGFKGKGSMDSPSPKAELDISGPEGKGEVVIDKPDVKVEGEDKDRGFGFHLPKFHLKGKGSVDKPDADIDINAPKADVDIQGPEGGIDIQAPDVDISGPEGQIDIKAPDVDVDIEKPKMDVDIDGGDIDAKGKKKFGFHMPKFGFKGKGSVDSPKAEVDVSGPDASGEVVVDKPEVKVEGDDKDRGWGIHLPKFHLKGKGSADKPDVDLGDDVDMKVKAPDADFDIKGPKADINISGPEGGADIAAPALDISGPEGRIDIKAPDADVDIEKPKIDVDVDTGDIEGGGKKKFGFHMPKFGFKGKGSSGSPSPKAEVNVSAPDVDVDIEKPKVDVDVDGGDVDTGGKKKFGFHMPKFGFKGKGGVDSPSPKAELDVSGPEGKGEVVIDKPDVKIEGDDKDRGWGIHLPKFNLKGKGSVEKPEADFEGDVGVKVKGPDADFDVKAPQADIDIHGPEAGIDIQAPDVDISGPEGQIDIKAPDVDVNIEKPQMDVDIDGGDIDAKGKKKFGFHMPKFGFKGKGSADIDAKTPKADVDVKGPEGSIDIQSPDMDVSGPQGEVDVNLPDVDVDVEGGGDIDAKGRKKFGFHMPKFGFKGKGGADVPSPKAEVDVSGPEASGELVIDKPDVKVEGGDKDRSWGIHFPKFNLKGKGSVEKPDADIEGDIDIKAPKGDVDIKGPEGGIDISAPDIDVSGPEGQINITAPDVDVDIQKPKMDVDVDGEDIDAKGKKKFGFHMPKFGFKGKGSMDSPSPKADVDISGPEGKGEVVIDKPDVKVEGEEKDRGFGFHLPKFHLKGKGSVDKPDADIDINAPQADVDIQGPAGGIDIQAPDVDISGPEGQIDIKAPDVDVDIEKPKMDVDIDGGDLDGKGKKKFGFHMPKFGFKGKVSGDKPDAHVGGDIKVTTPDADIDVNSPKADIDIQGPEGGIDIAAPDVNIRAPEGQVDIQGPGVDVDIEKPKLDVDVDGGDLDGKGKKKFGFHMPKFGFKGKAGVDSPSPKADVDISGPEGKGEIVIDKPEIKVEGEDKDRGWGIHLPKFHLKGKSGVDKPDVDAGADVNIRGPEADIELPEGRVQVDQPDIAGDINIQGPDVDIKGPEVDIDGKGGVDVDAGSPKGKTFGFHLPSFGFKRSPKDDEDEQSEDSRGSGRQWGIHLPKFKGKAKVEGDVSPPDVDVDISGPKADVDIEAPKGKVDIDLPEGDLDISAPKAEVNVVTPKGDIDVSAPKVDIDVERPDLDVDLPKGTSTPKRGKFHIGMPKFGGSGEKEKVDVFVKEEEIHLLPRFKHKGHAGGVHLDADMPEGEAHLEGPDVGVSGDVKLPSGSVEVESPKANVDIGGVDVRGDVELPDAEVNVQAPDVDVDSGKKKGGFKFKMPHFDLDLKGKSSSKDVKSPEVEAGAGVDGDVDVNLPGAKVDVDHDVKVDTGDVNGKVEGDAKGGGGFKFKMPKFKFKRGDDDDEENYVSSSSGEDEIIDYTKKGHKFKFNLFGKKEKPSVEGSAEAALPDGDAEVKVTAPDVDVNVEGPDVAVSGPSADMKKQGKGGKFSLFPKGKVKIGTDAGKEREEVDVTIKEEECATLPRVKGGAEADVKGKKSFTLPFFKTKGKKGDIKIDAEGPEGNIEVQSPSNGFTVDSDVDAHSPDIQVGFDPSLKVDSDIKLPEGSVEVKSPSVNIEGGDVDITAPQGGIAVDLPDAPRIDVEAPKLDIESPKGEVDIKSDKPKKGKLFSFGRKKSPRDVHVKGEVSQPELTVDIPGADLSLKRTDSPIDVEVRGDISPRHDERVVGGTEVIKEPFKTHFGAHLPTFGDVDAKGEIDFITPSVTIPGLHAQVGREEDVPEVDPKQYQYPFKHLVLQGQGLTCTAHVGVIKSLEENNVLKNIKHFVGTGFGGLTASLVASGCDSNILSRYLNQEIPKLTSVRTKCLPTSLTRKYGHTAEERVNNWMGAKLKGLVSDPNVTLSQLKEKTGNKLTLIVTNATQMKAESLNPDTTPNLPVRTAVRMCLARKGMLKPFPHKLHGDQEEVFYSGALLRPYPVDEYDRMFPEGAPEEQHDVINDQTLGVVLHSSAEVKDFSAKTLQEEGDEERGIEAKGEGETPAADVDIDLDEASLEASEIAAPMMRFLETLQKHQKDKNSRVVSRKLLDTVLEQRTDLPHDDLKLLFGDKRSSADIFKVVGTKSRNEMTYHELMAYFDKKISQHDVTHTSQDAFDSRAKKPRFEAVYIGVQEILSATSSGPLYNLSRENLERSIAIDTGDINDQEMVSLEESERKYLNQEGYRATTAFLKTYIHRQGLYPSDDDIDAEVEGDGWPLTRKDISELIDEELSEIIDERDYDENCKFVGSYNQTVMVTTEASETTEYTDGK